MYDTAITMERHGLRWRCVVPRPRHAGPRDESWFGLNDETQPRHAELQKHPTQTSTVVANAYRLGMYAGMLIGGALGTAILPVVGTMIGAIVGTVVSIPIAAACVVTLAPLLPHLVTRGGAAVVGGGIGAFWCAGGIAVVGSAPSATDFGAAALVGVCVGIIVTPLAVFGEHRPG